jgi:hypothetical protein
MNGLVLAALALGAAAAQTDGAVMMRFKFKVGQVQRFKLSIRSSGTVTSVGGSRPSSPVDASLAVDGLVQERVTASGGGGATIIGVQETLKAVSKIGTVLQDAEIAHGKLSLTKNGKTVRTKGPAPVTLRRGPTGAEQRTDQTAEGSFGDLVLLPNQPVKAGDKWESVQKLRPRLCIPLIQGGLPEVEMRYSYTLRGIEKKNGNRHARVYMSAAGTIDAPQGSFEAFSCKYSGTTRVDLDRGVMISGSYDIAQSYSLKAPSGAPAGAPQALELEATAKFSLFEVPATKK